MGKDSEIRVSSDSDDVADKTHVFPASTVYLSFNRAHLVDRSRLEDTCYLPGPLAG